MRLLHYVFPYVLRKPVVGGNTFVVVAADGDDLVHSDGKTAAKACELIARHRDEPFFLAVGFVRPHVPFVAPKPYHTPYPPDATALPEKRPGDWDDIPKPGINYKTSVTVTVRDTAFCVAGMSKGLMLRDDRWVFIQYGEDAKGGIELFDMQRDPHQFTNLATSPEHATIVAGWQAKLAAKLKAVRSNDLSH